MRIQSYGVFDTLVACYIQNRYRMEIIIIILLFSCVAVWSLWLVASMRNRQSGATTRVRIMIFFFFNAKRAFCFIYEVRQ